MSDPITSAPIITKLLDDLASNIGKGAGKVAKPIIDRAVVDLGIGFNSYLNASYNRCRFFKTILDPSHPLEVVSHYVNADLQQGAKILSDTSVIDDLYNLNRVVITGLAGSGKSMLMKYLTVCKFENPAGKVPLFVELRHTNVLTQQNLLEFIRASCTSKGHKVTKDQFELSLSYGAFCLILDGFDEINHDLRGELERQILDIANKYPEVAIVISSRPDERFNGWSAFNIFKVKALNKQQCLKLISSLDYNLGVKRRFHKEVKNRLYESHESFLSSPLLTTIMLLTYEEYAEIPVKMHSFYGQAFDTLFQKHDAAKEQFQRKTHTGLSREDFKFAFGAFCAMSYLDEKFSFEIDYLDQVADSAVKYLKQSRANIPATLTRKHLIDDMKESVCLLQQDGIETSFMHRSFQEYFAAVFATSLTAEKIKIILDKYSRRIGDSVITMAVEIAREMVEQAWVLPTIDHLTELFSLGDSNVTVVDRLKMSYDKYIILSTNNIMFPSISTAKIEVVGPVEALARIYPDRLGGPAIFYGFLSDLTTNKEELISQKNIGKIGYTEIKSLVNSPSDKLRRAEMDLEEDSVWWIELAGIPAVFDRMHKGFAAIKKDISSRASKRQTILEDFL